MIAGLLINGFEEGVLEENGGGWTIDPADKQYKRHTGESWHPAVFKVYAAVGLDWNPSQTRNNEIYNIFSPDQ